MMLRCGMLVLVICSYLLAFPGVLGAEYFLQSVG